MGYTPGASPKGGPLFTPAPQTVADLNATREFAELVGNRKIGTTSQRDALTGSLRWEGLEFYDTTLKRTFIFTGGIWAPAGATIELFANPLVNNDGVPDVITPWTVQTAKSIGGDTILSGISGGTITLFPGTYIVSAMVTLNNSGAPQGVSGRSFIEVLADEGTLDPRLRANAAVGEDSWSVSGIRSFATATSMVVRVLATMAPSLAGSRVSFIASRIG